MVPFVLSERVPIDSDVAKQILRYFMRHPRAADDLEGIARWRLLEEAVHRTVDETEQAIHMLVGNGLLEQVGTPDGGRVFRINEARLGEAAKFLEQD